ncbi:hypothetical protein ACQBAT_05075 [Ornithinimicrobium sp. Y1847]|uniref:hypothetical protein n=1 Tax=Ornithinimicrobium sp. Y1847 TaxID=3405419 RepID=UPI003B678B6F
MSTIIEWALRLWAVVLVVCAAVWVAVRAFALYFVPWQLTTSGPLDGLLSGLTFGAYFDDREVSRQFQELSESLTDLEAYNEAVAAGGPDVARWADLNVGWHVQIMDLTWLQNVTFIALHVVPLLALAWIWWALADIVRDSRRGSVFTEANARRLTAAGLLVLVGAPLVALGSWALHGWALAGSTLADRMTMPTFGLAALPWGLMAAGAGLIVLGVAWRRAVRLEHEVEGLV